MPNRLLWEEWARDGVSNDMCGILGTITGFRADPILSTSDIAAVRTFAAPRGLLQSVRLPRQEVSVSQDWEVGHMTMSINVRMKG